MHGVPTELAVEIHVFFQESDVYPLTRQEQSQHGSCRTTTYNTTINVFDNVCDLRHGNASPLPKRQERLLLQLDLIDRIINNLIIMENGGKVKGRSLTSSHNSGGGGC